jgi:hypothetical protein
MAETTTVDEIASRIRCLDDQLTQLDVRRGLLLRQSAELVDRKLWLMEQLRAPVEIGRARCESLEN